MSQFADEAGSVRDDDSRTMARLVRRLYDRAGMGLTDPLERALRRLEAGEDPDRIEREMGDLLDGPLLPDAAESGVPMPGRRRRALRTDESLYEL
jgi:hypothetical protein